MARYDLAHPDERIDTPHVQSAFTNMQQRARLDLAWEPDMINVTLDWRGPRHGPPVLVRPRMGQGHFKRAVAE